MINGASESFTLLDTGCNLKFSIPVLDADHIGIHESEQSIKIKVRRQKDGKWWSGTDWVDPEPASFNLPCIERESDGVYVYTLLAGYELGQNLYNVQVLADGIVTTGNGTDDFFTVDFNIIPKADVQAIAFDYEQAIKLRRGLKGTFFGTVVDGFIPTTTKFKVNLPSPVTKNYNNRVITFINDGFVPCDDGESLGIISYDGLTKIVEVTEAANPPLVGSQFVVT